MCVAEFITAPWPSEWSVLPVGSIYTAKAPVNIAVIKYWGKSNDELKIPINDSISGTLSIEEMCATTSIAISDTYETDEFWLNGTQQDLSGISQARILIGEIRKLSNLESKILGYKVHIVSHNNFPTAAGLASSAAGYACLAFVLGHAYGISDPTELSKLARRGSGSACRSLFGGFVHWDKGDDNDTSKAIQVVSHLHWPEMRVVICVANDKEKDVSSSEGMFRSVETSALIEYRAKTVVPSRVKLMKEAIIKKDFETFANLTMQDSNQFHAICLDTFPPIFYLNEASRNVIRICTLINSIYGKNKVAYTFDAGPNACIYVLDEFVEQTISIISYFFPVSNLDVSSEELLVKGKAITDSHKEESVKICSNLSSRGVERMPNSLRYLISTSIGDGPKLTGDHIDNVRLKP